MRNVAYGIAFAIVFCCAALLTARGAWAADGAPLPPAPPPAPAPVVVAGTGNCGCCPPRDVCRKSHFEVQGHLALLTPDPEGTVGIDTGAGAATWDVLEYEPEFGGRVAFTFPWCAWDVTLAGTWWGNWSDEAAAPGTLLGSQSPGGQPTPIAGEAFLREEATLWDVNLTLTKPFYCTPCFTATWGFGLRYLHFEEDATATIVPTAVVAVFPTVTIDSDIDNDLLAAELVVAGDWKLSTCWHFVARGSLFGGWMHREGEISATGLTPPPQGTTAEDDSFGFGGEAEIALVWRPSACWSVSVGYGLLALGNVARAHESIDFTNLGAFDLGPVLEDDVILVHRVFLGVGFDF
jgi:hypothetical protein